MAEFPRLTSESSSESFSYVNLPGTPDGSANSNGGVSLRRWFCDVIQPTFASAEAAAACDKADGGDDSPLATAHKRLRRNSLGNNAPAAHARPADKVHPALVTRWFAPLQAGSLRTCTSTLVASSLGTGILSLPFAFALCGIGLGMVTLTFAATVAALSAQVLIMAARYTECKSYAELFELAVGHKSASIAVDGVVLLLCMGAVACYLIFEGDFLPSLLEPFSWAPHLTRERAIIGIACLVWPLTLPSDISALRYVTVASPVVLLATTGAVLSETPARYENAIVAGGEVAFWDFEFSRWLRAFSIMLTAFTNQQIVVAAGNQLTRPSVRRIVKATTNATGVGWTIYVVIGIGGYLSWLSATQGNFIANYPRDSPVVWSCRCLLALALYCVIPVVCMPSAASLLQLGIRCFGGKQGEHSAWVHALSATTVLWLATITALKISNVATMIGLLGGVCASMLMFWFPAIIFVKVLYPVQPPVIRVLVLACLIFCGLCGSASAAANVYQMIH